MGYILVEYSVCIYIISLEIYTYLFKKTCIITEFVSYKTFKGQRRFSPHLHNTSESNSSYLHVHFKRLALTRCQKRVAQNPWKKTHGCCKFLQKTTEVPSPPQKNRLKGAYPCGSFHKNFLSFGGGKPRNPQDTMRFPKFRNRGIPTSIVVPSTGLGVHAVVLLLKAAASQIKPWCIKATHRKPPKKTRGKFGASGYFSVNPSSPQKMKVFHFWGNLSETFQMDGSNI